MWLNRAAPAVETSGMDAAPTAPTAEPQLSADGQWWWNGQAWTAVTPAPAAPTVVPQQQVWPASTAQPKISDGLGLTSLVLSILWVGGISSVAGVVCGHVSAGRARRAGRSTPGVTTAGIVLGYLGIAFTVLVFATSVAVPVFLQQRAAGREHVLAQAVGVPPAVEARFGGSPYTPEQVGATRAELLAERRSCAPALQPGHPPEALTYAAIQFDTDVEEELLSLSLRQTQVSLPEQRAEMVRIDQKKIAAIRASPALARDAAPLVAQMSQYDALLAASPDDATWSANVAAAHAVSSARTAAAVQLRRGLRISASSCGFRRP